MKRACAWILGGALVVWAAADLAAATPEPAGQVKIDNFSFSPQTLTVKAGGTVTWTNNDDVPHTVVSTTKKFASMVLETDGQFSFTFSDPGTYDYFCSVHPHMTGKAIVQ